MGIRDGEVGVKQPHCFVGLHTLTRTDASFLSLKLFSDYIERDSLV